MDLRVRFPAPGHYARLLKMQMPRDLHSETLRLLSGLP